MTAAVTWFEAIFGAIPLPLLEVWGRFAYIVGLVLAVCAFGGFTFRIGERWGFGRARQTWDAKAFLSLPLTFVLIIAAGYIGSFIVLVPGAQTFESLKDLVVLLSIVLFGYPALLAVPPAYMLSDLIEGVPPGFVLNWAEGYFFWAAFVWMAYQLIGRNPDFRRASTWRRYGVFVGLIMLLDPVMWGFICAEKFTPAISYRTISSALAFTLTVTWLLAPLAFLIALPLARRFGWFWAEIPGHVGERPIGSRVWRWEAGRGAVDAAAPAAQDGLPIRLFIFAPFVALVLVMVGATAIVALWSADDDAERLAIRLHQEASASIRMRIDNHLARPPPAGDVRREDGLAGLLQGHTVASNGRAFILDAAGRTIASTAPEGDPVVQSATAALTRPSGAAGLPAMPTEFRFDHVTAKPLSRETWLSYATPFRDNGAGSRWLLVTALPESFYLAGLRQANSWTAMIFALALVLALVLAAALASMVTAPLRQMARATQRMARGDLDARAPVSRLQELKVLAESFNDMAGRLKASFDELVDEVETRKGRERELAQSEALLRTSEERWRSLFESSTLGILLTDQNHRLLDTNRALQTMLGYSEEEMLQFTPLDLMAGEEREAGRRRLDELGDGVRRSYEVVTRYRRKDGTPIWVNTFVTTIPGGGNSLPIFFATAIDITDRYKAESELRRQATYLSEAEKLSHTGSWAWNVKTGETFWSPEEWRIVGLDPDTTPLSHQTLVDLIHPDDRAAYEDNSRRAIEHNEPYDIAFRIVRPDGTVRHLHSVGKPQFEASGEVIEYLGVTTDETERIRANAAAQDVQAELARVARLTTMGELAASIAHEINQPLAAVVANGNAALRWLGRAEPNLEEAKDALNAIVEEGNRASDVIGRVRTLLRNRKPEYVGLDINEAVREVLGLAGHALRSRGVAVRQQLAVLPPARGDRVQLQQVVMNLVMNGADAMGSVNERQRVLQIESLLDGEGRVLVSVKDSGTGIEDAIRDRIFEPLFTTKSSGMGMGLSICRSIVEAHGGRLWASPAEPHGTDFRFTIPVSTGSSADPA